MCMVSVCRCVCVIVVLCVPVCVCVPQIRYHCTTPIPRLLTSRARASPPSRLPLPFFFRSCSSKHPKRVCRLFFGETCNKQQCLRCCAGGRNSEKSASHEASHKLLYEFELMIALTFEILCQCGRVCTHLFVPSLYTPLTCHPAQLRCDPLRKVRGRNAHFSHVICNMNSQAPAAQYSL